MSYWRRLRLYLYLLCVTRGAFERSVSELLERREQLAPHLRKFLESREFITYWRECWRHNWRAVSQYGLIDLGVMTRPAALREFAAFNPRARILSVDEVHHFIFFAAE